MRLGGERALLANTFKIIKDLWVSHSNALIDKPQQNGFAEWLEYDLSGANMTDANMTDANMTDANMTDANTTDANMTDANMTDANMTDAI
jgi:uncharacterized protein YjbI with pentapeptide repeats